MPKYHRVHLAASEREELLCRIRTGVDSARVLCRARILLHADESPPDEGWFDDEIASALHVGRATVERVRKRFGQGGLPSALYDRPQPKREPEKMTGELEAHLIAMTCGAPPEGHKRWTLRLLAEGMVEAGFVDALSHECVRQTLKKTNSSLG